MVNTICSKANGAPTLGSLEILSTYANIGCITCRRLKYRIFTHIFVASCRGIENRFKTLHITHPRPLQVIVQHPPEFTNLTQNKKSINMKAINRTTLFLILTFVITYLLAGIYKLSGGDITNRIGFTVLGAIIMFIPTISVIIVNKLIHHEKLKTDLLISFKINKWFFIAWLILPVIMLFSLGISLIFPDVIYSLEMAGFIKRFESMLTPEQIEQMRNSLATLPINPIWLFLLQGLIA